MVILPYKEYILTKTTSIKIEYNKSLNDLCEIEYSEVSNAES